MSTRIALHHRTVYRFDRQVGLGPHSIRLRPAPHCRTRVTSYSLTVRPAEHFLNWQQDPQGNHVARVVFPEPTRELVLEVDLVAELVAINAFDFFLEPQVERFPFAYDPVLAAELAPYLALPSCGPLVAEFLAAFLRDEGLAAGRDRQAGQPRTIDVLVALNRAVRERVGYVIRMEAGVQDAEQTLALSSGSCRDSAWLLVTVMRRLGLAARFCSGYLVQLAPDVQPLDGPPGPKSDFTDLHAWTEVFLPGAGWVGFDPTSGLLAAEGHLPLASTPDPASAAPVSGVVDPCASDFHFEMRVERIEESPRTTRPFGDDQWQRILSVGDEVDAALVIGDVRLTCGGEPTYVSIDDFDSPEWNISALGADKRSRAGALARRLLDRVAPGGVLLESQGKWYPGEPLPRWALELAWRDDGREIWSRRDLIAPDDVAAGDAAGVPVSVAGDFLRRLAAVLGLDPAFVMAAREVPVHDPLAEPVVEPRHPTAFVLPLLRFRRPGEVRWRSSEWPMPADGVPLVPGDSPAGLRLPMAALPWPDEAGLRDGTSIVRTATVTEVRGGRLHVFLPPVDLTAEEDRDPLAAGTAGDDWLELVAAVERVAVEFSTPVVLEGYPPPHDPRLRRLHVTPDPGVIEVNVPPVATWRELVRLRETLDEEARASRLCAEKFEIDGLHTGTGGGDHLVLGGVSPTDSPFLRRPHLLGSLVAYFNNHPSLSYLFAGRFIGPTSQAPRIDEARHESLYELEIALQELAAAGPDAPPWFVDRVFRNLLTDLTGNTHRAEFCIDKLYSPDTAGGRRGLVELRGFEMAPHVRMGLLSQLVVRALIAWLWREPREASARAGLVRWGTALHDRFLLPHFLMTDFGDVLGDLRRAGFAFDREWFECFAEFRFPRLGAVTHDGVRLELRSGLEPWHVLGEQPIAGAMSRAVDSSLERVQVLAAGLVPGRHAVACNGRRVPLVATGRPGEFVAGVRFRAWQPANCLHPTIPVHSPLVFDVVDMWNGRSLGGCTWHVVHPGGRSFETRPVNVLEAESRRVSRFFATGHTPGPCALPIEEPNPDYSCTLDLRRVVRKA
ncbi:MAG: transglutaminase family protein [Planctomycetia bacterium]|nr:transglutaminase family protein [Planctomycetia bacterium]